MGKGPPGETRAFTAEFLWGKEEIEVLVQNCSFHHFTATCVLFKKEEREVMAGVQTPPKLPASQQGRPHGRQSEAWGADPGSLHTSQATWSLVGHLPAPGLSSVR